MSLLLRTQVLRRRVPSPHATRYLPNVLLFEDSKKQNLAHRSIQCRYWTPHAYRREQTSRRPISPRRTRKRKTNGADITRHKAAAREASHQEELQHSSHTEDLKLLQRDCHVLVARYFDVLFPDMTRPSLGNGVSDIKKTLEKLHEQSTKGDGPNVKLETLVATEADFRDLCKLLDRLAAGYARSLPQETDGDEIPSMLSERLLQGLVQMRLDRSDLIRIALEKTKSSDTFKWTDWLKDIFVVSPGQQPTEPTMSTAVENLIAHQDANFGPSASTYADLIGCIYNEDLQGASELIRDIDVEWNSDDFLRPNLASMRARPQQQFDERAKRMMDLFNEMSRQGLTPHRAAATNVLKAYAYVGSLESAIQAEKIYSEHQGLSSHRVLLAYRLSALLESSPTIRAEAVDRAERFLLACGGEKNQHLCQLVLEAIGNAGRKALPDSCERAEELIVRCISEKEFAKLIILDQKDTKTAPFAVPPLALLHSLISIYCQYEERTQQALNLIRCMEHAHSLERKRGRAHRKHGSEKSAVIYPNVSTYNSVLRGLLSQRRRAGKVRGELDALICSAQDIFDRMTLRASSWPNQLTFIYLLRIAGANLAPEEVLSLLEARRYGLVESERRESSIHPYHYALRNLKIGAARGQARTAHRAAAILDSMEAQSRPDAICAETLESYSEKEKEICSQVYDARIQPSLETYSLFLRVCSHNQISSEKESAFQLVSSVFNRMLKRGIQPDDDVFKCFIWCCALLLPKGSIMQREQVAMFLSLAQDLDLSKTQIKVCLIQAGLGYLLPKLKKWPAS